MAFVEFATGAMVYNLIIVRLVVVRPAVLRRQIIRFSFSLTMGTWPGHGDITIGISIH